VLRDAENGRRVHVARLAAGDHTEAFGLIALLRSEAAVKDADHKGGTAERREASLTAA
jgi:hypothetical protein